MTTTVVLLEHISPVAAKHFPDEWEILQYPSITDIPPDVIRRMSVIGIRSKTKLTKELLHRLPNLKAIGCYCIGTDQVHLNEAANMGIPVFNSPYANSRSVAELVIAQMINLARKLGDHNRRLHTGVWNKFCQGCFEIRGKTVGIIGYGHVGTQVGVLAENIGMNVIYYDVLDIMPQVNNRRCRDLPELLSEADFVTLHVPGLTTTQNLMTEKEFQQMKKGSYLLNMSRGSVVCIPDLVAALSSGNLAGAAIDVYPDEPKTRHSVCWVSELQGLSNVIMTPHIGGSTMEAQSRVARELTDKLTQYLTTGSTVSCVNLPEVQGVVPQC